MKFKEMEKRIKETHDKFFFVFRGKELKQVNEKFGIELNWKKIDCHPNIPEHVRNKFIVIDFDRIHFAELEKNAENIMLIEKAVGLIPIDKDCFCFDGFYTNEKEKLMDNIKLKLENSPHQNLKGGAMMKELNKEGSR